MTVDDMIGGLRWLGRESNSRPRSTKPARSRLTGRSRSAVGFNRLCRPSGSLDMDVAVRWWWEVIAGTAAAGDGLPGVAARAAQAVPALPRPLPPRRPLAAPG